MNIILLTPGAAGMYCGNCMRDNALAAALRAAGHDAVLIPLYTPLTTDEPDNSIGRIFYGGLNVYLQQKSSLFRKAPTWAARQLDSPGLLRFATSFGIKTDPGELGALTVSMLKGEEGFQAKELEKLVSFIEQGYKAEVVCLSNALLSGMAPALAKRLKVPVVCTIQGEDFFLDGLPEPHKSQAWQLLSEIAVHVAAFIAPSRYYADLMQKRMKIPPEKLRIVANGINLQGYAPPPAPPQQPAIGYLARLAPEKGLHTLTKAFKHIVERGKVPEVSLRIGGSMTANDKPFVAALRKEMEREGILKHVEIRPNLSRDEKIAFLQNLSVLSVPTTYGESFGLYLLEAWACGVPVVQPRHAAFPELIEASGGGILCAPGDAEDLAGKLENLLLDEPRRKELGARGLKSVRENYSVEKMAADVVSVFKSVK